MQCSKSVVTISDDMLQYIKTSSFGGNMGYLDHYYLLFNLLPDAIVKLDEKFQIIEVNQRFDELFKIPIEASEHKKLRNDLIASEIKWLTGMPDGMLFEEIRLNNVRKINLNAEHIDLCVTVIPIRSLGALEGYFLVYVDKTKEYQAEQSLNRQIKVFESLFSNSSDAIVRIDNSQKIIEINENFERFFGYTSEEIIGQTTDRLISSPDELVHNTGLTETLLSGDKVVIEGKRYAKDGTARDFLVQGVPITLENEVIGGYGIFTNITDLKNATKEIAAQKVIFEALFKNSSDAIIRFDAGHNIVAINENFTSLFGYTLNEIKNQKLDQILISENDQEPTVELTNRVLNGERIFYEGQRKGKQNRFVHVQIKGIPIIAEEQIIGGYGIYTDITEKKLAEEEILYISYHDQLTGAYNRRYFEEEMRRIDASRTMPVAMIMADVNGLKLTNDAFGHNVGDALLRRMAQILRHNCRDTDILARLGGDEFVILMPDTSARTAEAIIKRIESACEVERFNNINLSMSFGSDAKITADEPMSILFNRVENYMYRHKLVEGPSFRGKMFETIINTLHEKNKREERHSSRVSVYCEAIGNALRLTTREINELKTAGWLHDIGKIAVDEQILNKEGALTKEEWAEIKKHPETGYRILGSVNEMAELSNLVLSHHERFDGRGYPKGLRGYEIPRGARIIAVADAYDAMTTARTYRAVRTKQEAIDELLNSAGKQFDPEIVQVFVEKVLTHLDELTLEKG